jgi:hypothetical protein
MSEGSQQNLKEVLRDRVQAMLDLIFPPKDFSDVLRCKCFR